MNYIKAVSGRIINSNEQTWNMDAKHFDWGPGVFLAGVLEAYQATNDEELLVYMKDWAENYLEQAYEKTTVNSMAPLIMILGLYEITKDEKYMKVCTDIANWTLTNAPLTIDGGLEHTVTEKDAVFKDQMWADTLFMSCIFLAKYGKITNNKVAMDFVANQLVLHHKLLKDVETGVFFHGWDGKLRTHLSAARWARANAWITISTPLILKEISYDFDGRDFVIKSLQEQILGVAKFQKKDGSFATVLDIKESYSEASATAGFAAGIDLSIEMGLIDSTYKVVSDKAKKYVLSIIDELGNVNNVSTGTPIMETVEKYLDIPVSQALYGQGLTLYMLINN